MMKVLKVVRLEKCYDTGEGFESGENVECGDIAVGIEACKGDEIGNYYEIS